MTIDTVVPLLVSTLGGAAVGVEREWSGHAEGEKARFAGLRTFTLLGLLGGMAGLLSTSGGQWLAALLVGSAAALVVVAYAAASRRDVDGTTEVAALVVLASGVLAGNGEMRLASGVIALTVLLLVEKSRLHALVRLLDDRGFRAGARFAVLALVVLPLLPEGPYGPMGGVRPRALWALVLFFSGLSFSGYIARTIVGDRYGITVAGLLGGLVSSTSVTLTYSRLSREPGAEGARLASGALAACAVLFVRVALAVAVLNPTLLPHLVPLLVTPLAVGAAAVWLSMRRGASAGAPPQAPSNPLQLAAALQMAAAFQIVLFLFEGVNRRFGNAGLLASAFALGLTDVDALTASMTDRVAGGLAPEVGAVAIAAGILSNSITKLGIALAIGRGRFRLLTSIGLLAMTLAGLAAAIAAYGVSFARPLI
ncbi:MAG: MgtC/SapB family protein [Vicinamibacteria bacterium]|nr:MgtC/SapB family protein [Vicinamibacteria bacterium]